MYYILSSICGSLIAVLLVMNSRLSEAFSPAATIAVIHLMGFIFLAALMAIKEEKIKLNSDIPLYLYSAGAMGVLTVLLNNIAFPSLGASLLLALGIFGQAAFSMLIDQYGLFGMPKVRIKPHNLVGTAIIAGGVLMMMGS